jgi:zinc D-Ala-D-Ala dipeptidase
MLEKQETIGKALDFVQKKYGKFGDFANMIPHLKSFSRDEINGVIAKEGFDPLIRISETERIIFLSDKPINKTPLFRKKAWKQLLDASEHLPEGIGFGIIECFRSEKRQLNLRDKRFILFKSKFPNDSDKDIWRRVDTFIARPGGPHQTGGVIDVCLIDLKTKTPFDMGSPGPGFSFDRKNYTSSDMISLEAQVHRYILATIMTFFGFRNYPAEWWHYEFGTKRHSRYMRFEECMYDVVNTPLV